MAGWSWHPKQFSHHTHRCWNLDHTMELYSFMCSVTKSCNVEVDLHQEQPIMEKIEGQNGFPFQAKHTYIYSEVHGHQPVMYPFPIWEGVGRSRSAFMTHPWVILRYNSNHKPDASRSATFWEREESSSWHNLLTPQKVWACSTSHKQGCQLSRNHLPC